MDRDTPGSKLALLMRRRGWSAPRLAHLAGGVSASSIRAYMADRTNPRPDHALALARSLGPVDGKALLESWGYTDLANGFYEEGRAAGHDRADRPTSASYRFDRVEHTGDPLSDRGLDLVRCVVTWIQHIEQPAASQAKPPPILFPTEPEEIP